jgi:uncharacterized membrane protein
MKRVLLSLLFSAIVITSYVITIVIVQIIFGFSDEAIKPFAIPIRLPSYIYYNVLHLQSNNDNELESIFFVIAAFLFNVVMYAPIFYLLFTLISKRKSKVEPSKLPPEPPIFN